MELLDKNLPSELASTAREAATRAVHAIEPFAEPLLEPLRARRSRPARLRQVVTDHPWAIGTAAVVLVGIVVVALTGSSSDQPADASADRPEQRIRSAA